MIDKAVDRLNELRPFIGDSRLMTWCGVAPGGSVGSIRLFLDLNPTICKYHEVFSEGFAIRGKYELD